MRPFERDTRHNWGQEGHDGESSFLSSFIVFCFVCFFLLLARDGLRSAWVGQRKRISIMDDGVGLRKHEGEGGQLTSFPQAPISTISSPSQPVFPLPTRVRCTELPGPVHDWFWGWLYRQCRMVWGERWDVWCSLPLALRKGGEVGYWRGGGRGVLCLGQQSPCCRLSHWAQGLFLHLCLSFPLFPPVHLPLSPSCSLHAFSEPFE